MKGFSENIYILYYITCNSWVRQANKVKAQSYIRNSLYLFSNYSKSVEQGYLDHILRHKSIVESIIDFYNDISVSIGYDNNSYVWKERSGRLSISIKNQCPIDKPSFCPAWRLCVCHTRKSSQQGSSDYATISIGDIRLIPCHSFLFPH